jgi:signal transduction histidine kinase
MRFHAKSPPTSPAHTAIILVGGSVILAIWIIVTATINTSANNTLPPMIVLLSAIATVLLCGLVGESRRRAQRELDLVIQRATLEATNLELAASKERAEQASRAKSLFLANMSHELKTPLNAIIGFAEVIKNQATDPASLETCAEYAEIIRTSGNHLHSLISNILDLAKIESGKMALDEEPIEINSLIDACIGVYRYLDTQKKITFETDLPTASPLIRGDALRLRQALANLLSNAVKFTPEAGRVAIRLEHLRNGELLISVSDTGIGMSADEIRVALEPFGQIDNGLAKLHDGAGIGLPLAKSLIELHGGRLVVESSKGAGTTISAYLPADRIIGRVNVAETIDPCGLRPVLAGSRTTVS